MSEKRSSTSAIKLQHAVMIELDYAVLQAMKPQAEACRGVLAKAGIKLDEALFLRQLVGHTPAQGISALAQQTGKSVDVPAVASAVADACREATLALLPTAASACGAFVRDLVSRNLHVFLLTGVPEAQAQAAVGDLCGEGVVLHTEPQTLCGCYGWESWRRAARKLQLRERLTVALAGSGLSSKGALAASMHVIVRPDPLAESQDCSGADDQVQKFDAAVRTEILRLLRLGAPGGKGA